VAAGHAGRALRSAFDGGGYAGVAFSGIFETFEAFGLSQDSCIVNFGRDGSSGPSGPGGQWVAGSPGAGAVQWLFWAKRPLADWFTWLIDPSRFCNGWFATSRPWMGW